MDGMTINHIVSIDHGSCEVGRKMWALANDNVQFLWVKHEVNPIVKGMMMMMMMMMMIC